MSAASYGLPNRHHFKGLLHDRYRNEASNGYTKQTGTDRPETVQ
ncbi:hypothetical protein CZ787_09055 [Halomonas citrativorans]|uniref:Uncharacterized protein n=1 Tax=Halomonas citrativorans TaxID=2742612 RepID=A0A1R4HZU3_9GAMM|nr:hypothetical protein CZ787_09055 [Halomonas citrativorans]